MGEDKYYSIRELFKKDEIYISDFYTVFKFVVVQNLKLFFAIAFFISIIASIYYFTIPVEYESKSVVYIESSKPNANSENIMKDLMLGNLPTMKDNSISPEKYKAIIASQAFLNELIEIRFPQSQNSKDSTSLLEYFTNNPSLGLFDRIKFGSNIRHKIHNKEKSHKPVNKSVLTTINREIIFSNQIPPIVDFDNERLSVFSTVEKRITLNIKDNAVSLSVKMPTPFLSAIVGKVVLERLLIYISSMGTYKQKSNVEYLSQRLSEAESNYRLAQKRFAGAKDSNLGAIFESSQTNNQVLNNNMTIAFNIYNQIAMQYEQSKIELKKETPYFSILEPISIPSSPIQPNFIKFIFLTTGIIFLFIFLIIIIKFI